MLIRAKRISMWKRERKGGGELSQANVDALRQAVVESVVDLLPHIVSEMTPVVMERCKMLTRKGEHVTIETWKVTNNTFR